jgi:hypothetical protein
MVFIPLKTERAGNVPARTLSKKSNGAVLHTYDVYTSSGLRPAEQQKKKDSDRKSSSMTVSSSWSFL